MIAISNNKPPIWFWAVSAIAFIFYLSGIVNMFVAAFGETPWGGLGPHRAFMFVLVCIGLIYIITAALGSLGLLLRKKWSAKLFAISVITYITMLIYSALGLFIAFKQANAVYSLPIDVLMLTPLLMSGVLLWLSRTATKRHWVR